MKAGIVGLGKMGMSIFKLLADKGLEVTAVEQNSELLQGVSDKFFQKLERSLGRQGVSADGISRRKAMYHFSQDLSALKETDIVIEAVSENYDLKVSVFKQMETVVRTDTLLLTNSSSISIRNIEKELHHPERFCGYHFFHPVILIDLVEIIVTAETSEQVITRLKEFSRTIGKNPAVVEDGPGSVINSILLYYYVEAVYLLEEGIAPPSRIDKCALSTFYIGPFESIDVVGVDLFLDALDYASAPLVPLRCPGPGQEDLPQEAIGGRKGFYFPPVFTRLINDGRFGKKVSMGIYRYEKGKPVDDDRSYYVNAERVIPHVSVEKAEDIIRERLLFSLFNGVIYALKYAKGSEHDIDYGIRAILHMKEGPIAMMKHMGLQQVSEKFGQLSKCWGPRFQIDDMDRILMKLNKDPLCR